MRGHLSSRTGDRGAVLVLTALAITALLLIVAIVIDLGATRSDRRDAQGAVDNAAAAAGKTMVESGAVKACETAIIYLQQSLDQTFSGHNCSTFSSCPPGGVVSASTAGYRIRLHYPVQNGSPLLGRPGTIGARTTPFVGDRPGDPCKRIGIELDVTGDAYFGGIAGQDERRTSVHAVVVAAPPGNSDRLINLAVLQRKGCDAIVASGNGGVLADALSDPKLGLLPGVISVDADGLNTDGTDCSTATITTDGNGSIRADGPDCDGPPIVAGPVEGCGVIELVAKGAPGCNKPACMGSFINPTPVRSTEPLTRAPVDHEYNCKTSYASEGWYGSQPIIGCTKGGQHAHIDELRAKVGKTGRPAGFLSFSDAGYCPKPGPPPPPVQEIPVGNWHVECALSIANSVVFLGGNVVFDSNVEVKTSGSLTFNTVANTGTIANSKTLFDITQSSSQHAFFYMRSGTLSRSSKAAITLNNTVGFLGPGAGVNFGGNEGTVKWTAPSAGPLIDLALWSDSEEVVEFGGQAGMVLDGAYFVPLAKVLYTGQGGNKVTAQFISFKLEVKGLGALRLTPTRGVEAPPRSTVVTLIR